MNLPNKLTIFRILIVPFFVWVLLADFKYASIIAVTLFILASLTDLLDGYIARKYELVTDFGKFADPIADKILVISACVCLVEKGIVPAWSVLIIIFREFIVSGLRMSAASKNIVIPADKVGKLKTVTQMIAIILLISGWLNYFYLPYICYYISIFLTLISGIMYIIKAKDIIL